MSVAPPPARLRVMADYSAFPVWGDGGMIDPGDLPVPDALRADLAAWNEEFDATWPDGWSSDAAFVAWRAVGRRLAARLQLELGDGVVVLYWHDREQGRPLLT